MIGNGVEGKNCVLIESIIWGYVDKEQKQPWKTSLKMVQSHTVTGNLGNTRKKN
jgi:hypothetical protein